MTKTEQRKQVLEARAALSPEQRADYSARIQDRLRALLFDWRGKTIFSYLPTAEEADPGVPEGFLIAYPVTEGEGRMEAYYPAADDPLAPGPRGIRQPDAQRGTLVAPRDVDIVLAPCVAFDEKCRRLGHGGGYYDRYLKRCPGALVVAAAFEVQRVPEIVTDGTDMPVHIVVTEERVYLL